MCMECLQYPCHPRCPNAPEPPAVYECAHCKEAIQEGDAYVEYGDSHYHEDCFPDAAPKLVTEDGAKQINGQENDTTNVGVCAYCEEAVLSCEDHWKYDDKLYHHECFMDAAQSLLEDEVFRSIAEEEPYEPEYDPHDE